MRVDMLDWVIVGGGPHGCHLARVLASLPGARPAGIRIVDPHPQLAAAWTCFVSRVGMRFLRSPSVHHIDLEPSSLRSFAYDTVPGRRALEAEFLGIYSRPSLRLFQAHLQAVVHGHQLAEMHLQGCVDRLDQDRDGWVVHAGSGQLLARRVALCLGISHQPAWPTWAKTAWEAQFPVSHIFQPSYQEPPAGASVVVIGGGITAGQVALHLASSGDRHVTLLSRHALRAHEFDADPGWMGPKYLAAFHATNDLAHRRQMIRVARQRGTMPSEVLHAVRAAEESGQLRLLTGEAEAIRSANQGPGLHQVPFTVQLRGDKSLSATHMVLCTGFENHRPGGALVDALIYRYGLPVAPCGFPALPPSLEWAPGLFVSGALSELEIGPVARNLIGARMAAGRIRSAMEATVHSHSPRSQRSLATA